MAFPPVISDIARYNGAISNREISENSMSTIKDVARLANVSVATVSRVMNNSPKASAASREVVQKAMAELGYTPNANARALVSQTCDTMGVVVGDVADPFFGALVKGVAAVAVEQGLHLLMGNGFHHTIHFVLEIHLFVPNLHNNNRRVFFSSLVSRNCIFQPAKQSFFLCRI